MSHLIHQVESREVSQSANITYSVQGFMWRYLGVPQRKCACFSVEHSTACVMFVIHLMCLPLSSLYDGNTYTPRGASASSVLIVEPTRPRVSHQWSHTTKGCRDGQKQGRYLPSKKSIVHRGCLSVLSTPVCYLCVAASKDGSKCYSRTGACVVCG